MSVTDERVEAPARDFDPDRAWRVHPQVALRDESFGALAYHYGTRRLLFLKSRTLVDLVSALDQFTRGLDAPICLTWELTYACNLACVHCLSSSGRRDPMELTPAEARHIVDELADMKVFYVNIGGGEPMLRPDFFDLVGYAVDKKVGVKFSTNGTRLTAERARRLVASASAQSFRAQPVLDAPLAGGRRVGNCLPTTPK